jgi:hypothetical protein
MFGPPFLNQPPQQLLRLLISNRQRRIICFSFHAYTRLEMAQRQSSCMPYRIQGKIQEIVIHGFPQYFKIVLPSVKPNGNKAPRVKNNRLSQKAKSARP